MLNIRQAKPCDIPDLLDLMRELAVFEDYIDAFNMQEEELEQRAFGKYKQCKIFVAYKEGSMQGYAVLIKIPFTYDLRPTVILKELYVKATCRSTGVGERLLKEAAVWGVEIGAGRMKWDVLVGNKRAEGFYMKHGGSQVKKWIAYEMSNSSMKTLVRN